MVGDRNIQKNRSQVLKRFTPMASRWEICTLSIEPSYKIVLSLKGAIQWELCIGSLHLPPDTWFHKPVDSGVNSSLCQWSATHSFSWSWSLADQYTAKSTYAMLCHGWTRAAMFFFERGNNPSLYIDWCIRPLYFVYCKVFKYKICGSHKVSTWINHLK